jgi:tetratricopeptide (TPR) repeat protein
VTVDVSEAAAPVVDKRRPWPGLDAFTEAQSPFFFGRDAEADELFRRVRRDVATLLFGQSGLGKTSLLQAGLFPRLRWADFLPILIRIDHSPGAPAPAAQVKAAVERTAAAADLSGVTPIGAQESLWGYFHRADRRLADYAHKEMVPVLVFDQFEEIFTQGLASDNRRATSQDFLAELAELVENRPPEALGRAIEADPDLVENFLFDRQDYRIVLALREDFLASLDSLRSRAPSLGRNRYRLRPMSGRQGLDAILNPAPGLVAPEVAQEIIRFIGGPSAEDAFGIARDAPEGFEVEPSLLSLVCRELNERRIARRLDQIGADLLAGSRDEIIEGFYERCLADQPEAVRAIVEDRLLSDSGYRESVTLDSARRTLIDAGVPAAALDELVRRRLLRTEERLGVPRVEIIHDVLTSVIRKSRDTRRLRQAEAAAVEHEAALRREQGRVRRAYWLSAAMALLVVITIGVAWWGWSSKVEAERQRALTDEQRAAAEAESKRAEENFKIAMATADTLVTKVGKQLRGAAGVSAETTRTILKTAEDAFNKLAATKENSSELQWHRASMMVSFSTTYRALGDSGEAYRRATAAVEVMTRLVASDPTNDDWKETLAVGLRTLGDALCQVPALRTCWDVGAALAEYRNSLEVSEGLTQKDSKNLHWQRNLGLAHSRIAEALSARGDDTQALNELQSALAIQQLVVEKDPTDLDSQADLADTNLDIGEELKEYQHDLVGAVDKYRAGLSIYQALANQDPGNASRQTDLVVGHQRLGDALVEQNLIGEALAEYRALLDIARRVAEMDPSNVTRQHNLFIAHQKIGDVQRVQGDLAGALDEYRADIDISQRLVDRDPGNAQWQLDLLLTYERLGLSAVDRNDLAAGLDAFEKAEKTALRIKEISPTAARGDTDLAWVQARLADTRNKIAGPAPAASRKK